jgi:hexokinase
MLRGSSVVFGHEGPCMPEPTYVETLEALVDAIDQNYYPTRMRGTKAGEIARKALEGLQKELQIARADAANEEAEARANEETGEQAWQEAKEGVK